MGMILFFKSTLPHPGLHLENRRRSDGTEQGYWVADQETKDGVSNAVESMFHRIQNGERSFITAVMEQFGTTEQDAIKVLSEFKKAKAVKINPHSGQYGLTNGAFWDKAVIQNAIEMADAAEKNQQATPAVADPEIKDAREVTYTIASVGRKWLKGRAPGKNYDVQIEINDRSRGWKKTQAVLAELEARRRKYERADTRIIQEAASRLDRVNAEIDKISGSVLLDGDKASRYEQLIHERKSLLEMVS